jgi:hypothetical protein
MGKFVVRVTDKNRVKIHTKSATNKRKNQPQRRGACQRLEAKLVQDMVDLSPNAELVTMS